MSDNGLDANLSYITYNGQQAVRDPAPDLQCYLIYHQQEVSDTN